jgi:chaperone required for assembly of F1-ATPase
MKRFYKQVSVEPVDGGWAVMLDGRIVRTARGVPQAVPSRPLAEALAAEWSQQGEEIDLARFQLRDMADFAIDVAAAQREETIADILAYAETDTLCYRADPDEPLYPHQLRIWEPVLTGVEARHDVRFERVSGILHRPQPPETLERLRKLLGAQDAFGLSALTMLASLAASLAVALAALEEGADIEKLWAAANCEEDWQAEHWGWDAVAADRRAGRFAAFNQALEFARLATIIAEEWSARKRER